MDEPGEDLAIDEVEHDLCSMNRGRGGVGVGRGRGWGGVGGIPQADTRSTYYQRHHIELKAGWYLTIIFILFIYR
jgi:hypothetical protein